MTEPAKPLRHATSGTVDDAQLKAEAEEYLARTPAAQLVGELLIQLRLNGFAWWTPDRLRSRWPASERMAWLEQRPDIRQHITTRLTGLAPRAARRMSAMAQAELVDAVIDNGDITTLEFEEEFEPSVTAVYGPAAEFWRQFRAWMPWQENTPDHQELVTWLITSLLSDRTSLRDGARPPILRHWDVRTAIDSKVWHARIPLDIRARIDEARLERERRTPNKAFNAFDDLAIATPTVIAANIPLVDLARVLDVAEKAMGFHAPVAEVSLLAGAKESEASVAAMSAARPAPVVAAPAPAAVPAVEAPVAAPVAAAAPRSGVVPSPAPPAASASVETPASAPQPRATPRPVPPPAEPAPAVAAVARPAIAGAPARPAVVAATGGMQARPSAANMAAVPKPSVSLSIPRPPADLVASVGRTDDNSPFIEDDEVSTSAPPLTAVRKPAAPGRRSRPPQR